MLTVEGLTVNYGRINAVKGISFDVRDGELVGLIGPNGAGKSSTLNAIAGVVPTAGGSVHFNGRKITGMAPEDIVRLGVGLVPEGRQIFSRLTVEENLKLAAGTLKNRDPASMRRVLDRYPVLEALRKTPAGKLSGGEQQMLVIARALLGRPKLLMLDEPSLGLAPRIVEQVFETLVELQQEGATILLVEQNAAQTVKAADRVWVLAHGEAEQIADTDAIGEDDLIAAYLGRRTPAA